MKVDLDHTETVLLPVGARTLKLEQVAGLSELVRASMAEGTDPYWAYLWPSARALAEAIGRGPELTNKRVLELGAGLGAGGLAAAAMGARVCVTDAKEEAVILAQRNAEANGLSLEARVMDWNHPPADLGRFDGIVAADVFYADGMLSSVIRFLRKHLAPDGLALITDPMRVMPGGVAGAARLHGLESHTTVLSAGETMTGGVTLYELWPRRSLVRT